MLRRAAQVIFGGILFAAGAYVLSLHRSSEEPVRSYLVLMAGALLFGGTATIMDGLFRPR